MMKTPAERRTLTALVPFVAIAAAACDEEPEGVEPEVADTTIALDLPSVPEFDMPTPNPDGTHPVRELRLKGYEHLDSEVEVKGHIVWDYDCATALRTPDMTDQEVERLVQEEPERCEVPNLYLADEPDADPEQGIWVVEVPRALRSDERRGAEPPRWAVPRDEVPDYEVGDEVVVTGTWALEAEESAAVSSEGLLVFEDLEHIGD